MPFTTVTVVGAYTNGDATPGSGQLQFQLSQPMSNDDVTREPTPVTVLLDSHGGFSVPLAATDDPGTSPVGVTYVVIERITATPNREYEITLSHINGVVDLSTLMPSNPPVQ